MPSLRVGIDSSQARAGAAVFDKSVNRMRDTAGRFTKRVDRADKSVKRMGRSMKGATKTVLGLVGAFAGFRAIRGAIRTIGTFEQSIVTLGAVSRATGEEFKRLEDTARNLGATTRFSATEAAEGLLFLARAGFSVNESLAAIDATLDLAQVAMLDLGSAADIASNVLKQFGLEADETSRVVDTLVGVSNRSNTTVSQLAQAMVKAGPIAAKLGIEIEEAAAAIGVLGDAGIQGSDAGTGLRRALLNLTAPTSKMKRTIKDLGLEIEDVNIKTLGLTKVMMNLRDANLDVKEAAVLFGARAATVGLIVADSADSMKELTDASEEYRGEAERIAKLQDQTLIGQFKALKSAAEEFALATGDAGLTGALKGAVAVLTDLVRTAAGIEGISDRTQLVILQVLRSALTVKDAIKTTFEELRDSIVETAEAAADALSKLDPRRGFTQRQRLGPGGIDLSALGPGFEVGGPESGVEQRGRELRDLETEILALELRITRGAERQAGLDLDALGEGIDLTKALADAMGNVGVNAKDAQDAVDGIADASEKAAESTAIVADVLASAARGAVDALTDAAFGVEDLSDSLADLAKQLSRLALQRSLSALIPSAKGNVFQGGRVVPFQQGGVLSSPTIFPLAGGNAGIAGEAGSEAIMPLKRGPGGRLGVEAVGGASQRPIVVNINGVTDFDSFRRSERQLKEGARRALRG